MRLNLHRGTWGGRRPGSGRKRMHSKGVAHEVRERVASRFPLHVNFKLRASIRNKVCLKLLKRAVQNSRSHGLRIIHFSLQSNHVHLILEAPSNQILSRGMRSLTITFAKGLKRGRVQAERYHLHVLRSVKETKNAVHYVLFNEQKHAKLKTAHVDGYSSLGFVRDLEGLAISAKMFIVPSQQKFATFLDSPTCWLLRHQFS